MTYSLHRGAELDLLVAAKFYRREGGAKLANRFLDEFDRVARLLVEFPGLGALADDLRRVHPLVQLAGLLDWKSIEPYWQFFCGETYLQSEVPMDPGSGFVPLDEPQRDEGAWSLEVQGLAPITPRGGLGRGGTQRGLPVAAHRDGVLASGHGDFLASTLVMKWRSLAPVTTPDWPVTISAS